MVDGRISVVLLAAVLALVLGASIAPPAQAHHDRCFDECADPPTPTPAPTIACAHCDEEPPAMEAQTGPTPAPAPTCPNLPPGVAVFGYGPGAQCQVVGRAGLGNPELIALGLLNAVDVWGYIPTAIQVCFRQRGQLKFLDAATSPRLVSDLAATISGELICGAINRAGTVALIRGEPAIVMPDEEAAPPMISGPARLGNCQLTTTDYLSLRGGPSVYYSRIDIIPINTRLTASARTSDWFLVNYQQRMGWVSGEWVKASAGCDDIGEALEAGSGLFLAPQAGPEEVATEAPDMSDAPAGKTATDAMDFMGTPLSACNLRTGDIVNFRAGPGLEYDIKAEIPNATSLRASERLGDWFRVEYDATMGWVNIDYVFRSGACG